MSPSSNNNKHSQSKVNEEKPDLEQSFFAELIYRMSDISQLAKWPLLILAVLCCAGSALIWYAREDWTRFLSRKDMAFLDSLLQFIESLLVVLKVSLVICFIIVFLSLALFLFLFFKRHTSKTLTEAVNVLLSNSFYFGISLIFVFLATLSRRQAAGRIADAAAVKIECANNLEKLGKALLSYAENNHYHYPTPDRWCDLLIEYAEVTEEDFRCPDATKGRCHYALNPNAEPLSRYDDMEHYFESHGLDHKEIILNLHRKEVQKVWDFWFHRYWAERQVKRKALRKQVLLFETKPGWNQSGRPELLTTERHRAEGYNILFNDGRARFVRTEQLYKSKWELEQKPATQNEESLKD